MKKYQYFGLVLLIILPQCLSLRFPLFARKRPVRLDNGNKTADARNVNDTDQVSIEPQEKLECETPPNHLSFQEKCQFIRTHCADAEDSPGIINYTEFYYCDATVPQWLKLILLILHLTFLFVFLGTAASDYFCPNLSTLAEGLRLPPDIAGVTFLALGNSAPDLFSSLLAINSADSVSMALGALIGAGLFVGGVIVGVVCLVARSLTLEPTVVELDRFTFIRDVGFLFVSVIAVGLVGADGKMFWWEGLLLLCLYIAYIIVILYTYYKSRVSKDISEIQFSSGISPLETQIQTSSARSSIRSHDENNSRKHSVGSFSTSSIDEEGAVNEKVLIKRLQVVRDQHRLGSIAAAVEFSDSFSSIEEKKSNIDGQYSFIEPCSQCSSCRSNHPLWSKQGLFEFARLQCNHYLPIFYIWKELSIVGKIVSILNLPAVVLLSLTVPVISMPEEDKICKHINVVEECTGPYSLANDTDEILLNDDDNLEPSESAPLLGEKRDVHKSLLFLHLRATLLIQFIISPFFVMFALGYLQKDIFTGFPGWALTLILSSLLAVSVLLLSFRKDAIKSPWLSFIGFLVGIFWIYIIANEVVGLLKAFGVVINVAESILGITVFAFGNSIGDFVSNVTMARIGYPTMSISACFAGPLINLLVSLGISGLLNTNEPPVPFHLSFTIFCTYVGLLLMLLFYLIYIPMKNYKIGKMFGVWLLVFYTVLVAGTIALDLYGFKVNQITFGLVN